MLPSKAVVGKVFVTKYALTEGIIELEVEFRPEFPQMVVSVGNHHRCFHGEGKEWHRDRTQAVLRAEEMRKAKLVSIAKQAKRLQAKVF